MDDDGGNGIDSDDQCSGLRGFVDTSAGNTRRTVLV
jgi:hypothetical protein